MMVWVANVPRGSSMILSAAKNKIGVGEKIEVSMAPKNKIWQSKDD
jgi:hypothetical protein